MVYVLHGRKWAIWLSSPLLSMQIRSLKSVSMCVHSLLYREHKKKTQWQKETFKNLSKKPVLTNSTDDYMKIFTADERHYFFFIPVFIILYTCTTQKPWLLLSDLKHVDQTVCTDWTRQDEVAPHTQLSVLYDYMPFKINLLPPPFSSATVR